MRLHDHTDRSSAVVARRSHELPAVVGPVTFIAISIRHGFVYVVPLSWPALPRPLKRYACLVRVVDAIELVEAR